jgi:hypothetical protein
MANVLSCACLLLLVAGHALAAAPNVSSTGTTGFPALSRDGKSVAVVVVDWADYEGVTSDVFTVLAVRTGAVEKRLELRKKGRAVREGDGVAAVAEVLKARPFDSLVPVALASEQGGLRGTVGLLSFQWKLNELTVFRRGRVVQSHRVAASRVVTGMCCGNLEDLETRCAVGPSLFGAWFSAEQSALVIEYRYAGARDGCEGVDEFAVVSVRP